MSKFVTNDKYKNLGDLGLKDHPELDPEATEAAKGGKDNTAAIDAHDTSRPGPLKWRK